MEFVREIIDSDVLDHIIKIPDSLKHRRVEIILLPIVESEEKAHVHEKCARGMLEKYKNPSLIGKI
jgi:hypothetical protein